MTGYGYDIICSMGQNKDKLDGEDLKKIKKTLDEICAK